jgi:hypothetical protein
MYKEMERRFLGEISMRLWSTDLYVEDGYFGL